VRRPASVLVDLIANPSPPTRTAAARTSTSPVSRSTALQVRPQASPMRAGGHQGGDEVGQVAGGGLVVVGEGRAEVPELRQGQRTGDGLGPAVDAAEVFDRVVR
jgi:hypothetical protein